MAPELVVIEHFTVISQHKSTAWRAHRLPRRISADECQPRTTDSYTRLRPDACVIGTAVMHRRDHLISEVMSGAGVAFPRDPRNSAHHACLWPRAIADAIAQIVLISGSEN